MTARLIPARFPLILLALILLAARSSGQAGDRKGEVQGDLPPELEVPPAPALSPEAELATFRIAPGLRVELVAAEPLVNDPVAAEFDEQGRLWVVEMKGYMPDVDGTDERAPVGSIVVLSDRDNDGRMDERVLFMDGLVLPRSVHPCMGGALVILPGEVLFCRDSDGDGQADERQQVDRFNGGLVSPEHALNGFVRTLDNWYRCANGGVKYRFEGGTWRKEGTTGGGQWGITKDDLGRVFFNTNSDPLRGDLFPSAYSLRNPTYGKLAGMNVRFAHDRTTWPARINPGVNRGYQPATLRDDFTLAGVTAVCGPHVYRGHALGEEYSGNAIVPEPSGNLVKRYLLRDKGALGLEAVQAYQGREFITSTDERFRPVNAFGGPDGALYLVDFYRGIIQHRVFVTSFLRKQIIGRGLEEPLGLGRIWRVVPEDHPRPTPFSMSEWSWTQLVEALSSANGWMRDAAQRVIVEEWEDDPFAADRLAELVLTGKVALGRIHALWTLHAVGALSRDVTMLALDDEDPRVAAAAVRVAEPYLSTGREAVISRVLRLGREAEDARLRHQCVLSLGAVCTTEGDEAIAELMTLDCSTNELRSAALSGLYLRELTFLADLISRDDWRRQVSGRRELLRQLTRCVVRQKRNEDVAAVLKLCTSLPSAAEWQVQALLEGILAGRVKGPKGKMLPVRLSSEPDAMGALAALEGDLASQVTEALVWPGKPGVPEMEEIRPLNPEERVWFDRGREVFAEICASCHQSSGLGERGKAPPLRGSEWIFGSERRLVRILAHGLRGPIRVDGQEWDMEMPAYPGAADDISAVLTYIRREWGHGVDPVRPETVRAVLEESAGRGSAWTAEELERLD